MSASVIRVYQEHNLHQGIPQGDRFLSAITRYYNVVRAKTIDLVTTEGYVRPGVYFMPERDHYKRDEEQGRLGIDEGAGP